MKRLTRENAIQGREIELGESIDSVIDYLIECRNRNESVYVIFNQHTLYSCDVTMESAYLQVYNLTKEEKENLEKEYIETTSREEVDKVNLKIKAKKQSHINEMKKNAHSIPVPGDLEMTIQALTEYKMTGESVYVDFNGHTLYSCDINKDRAYIEVTGLTKDEYDVGCQEMMDAQSREEEFAIKAKYDKLRAIHRKQVKKEQLQVDIVSIEMEQDSLAGKSEDLSAQLDEKRAELEAMTDR